MPRVKCESCGKIRTVIIDWARPGAGLSLLVEYHVILLMVDIPVAAVARKVGERNVELDAETRTGRAYCMKISLQKMFTRSAIISEIYFEEWYNWGNSLSIGTNDQTSKVT